MSRKLYIYASWNKKNISKSWSGTAYFLSESIKKKYEVQLLYRPQSIFFRLLLKIVNHLPFIFTWRFLSFIETQYVKKQIGTNTIQPVLMISSIVKIKNPTFIYFDNIWHFTLSLKKMEQHNNWSYNSIFGYKNEKVLNFQIEKQRDIIANAKNIFCMGQWLYNYICNIYPEYAKKMTHIGSGFNAQIHQIVFQNRIRNKILFVGRDFYRKGGDLVVSAFLILKQKYLIDAQLYIAGPKEIDFIKQDGIHLLGDVSYSDVGSLMHSCDLFCMPSRFEAYGLVFIEALMSGMPCIGRNSFEMPYFIENGKTGFLINDDDPEILAVKMYEILTNDSFYKNVSLQYDYYKKQYNWDVIASKMLSLILKE